MFKYTRAGINIIIDDIKKLAKIFKYGTLAFSALYYFVAILLKLGNLVVNIILAILFTAYTIFDFVKILSPFSIVISGVSFASLNS